MQDQGRVVGAKSAWPGNAQYGKFWLDLPFPKGYANFGGPAGGCSLRARCPLMAGMWLVEAVLLYRQSNTVISRGLEAAKMTNRKSRKIVTFSLIALDPTNRLRYPPVSLFFMMCRCWRLVLDFQQKLFEVRFSKAKVGC